MIFEDENTGKSFWKKSFFFDFKMKREEEKTKKNS